MSLKSINKVLFRIQLIVFIRIAASFLFILFLGACSLPGGTSNQLPKASPLPSQPTAVASSTATSAPLIGKVILVTLSSLKSPSPQDVQAALSDLVKQAGLTLETYPSIQPGDIKPEWKIVVFLGVPANLSDLMKAAPKTQFIVIGPGDLSGADNLSVVRMNVEQQAFLAGYLAETIAPDWRVGGLLPNDGALGANLESTFRNGGYYQCGRCDPVNGPIVHFPETSTLPSNSDPSDWQAAAAGMEKDVINVMYVAPEASSPNLLVDLVSKGIILVGGQTPPDQLRSKWAATVRQDALASLRSIWPDVMAGKGGMTVNAQLQLADINPDLFSPGRQHLVQQTMSDLQVGLIDPLSVPLQ
ncbi:MAG TPA: hypothetical protein VKF38_01015 [Anaerolineaceae bacterium]|nr:hypothetical protein [Anaerolineaceae bacterium]